MKKNAPSDKLAVTSHQLKTNRETLAQRVIEKVRSISVKLVELEDDIRALWAEFENLQPGESIAGCATKKEFCERMLHRTPRAVRYMLAGGNPDNHQGEIISPAQDAREELDEIMDEEVSRILQHGPYTVSDDIDESIERHGLPPQAREVAEAYAKFHRSIANVGRQLSQGKAEFSPANGCRYCRGQD